MLSINTLIWLLFVVFCCNDGEELLTGPAWIRRNPERYNAAPRWMRLDPKRSLTAQFAVAIAVVGTVPLLATLFGARSYATTGELPGLFVGVVAMIFLDGVKHILMAIGMRGYSSGVVSAALVQVPYGAYALHRFLVEGLTTWSEILRYGSLGVAVILPLLGLGFALGRLVVPARKEPLTGE